MIGHKYKSYEEKLKKRWNKNHPNLNEKVIFLKRMSSEKFLALRFIFMSNHYNFRI